VGGPDAAAVIDGLAVSVRAEQREPVVQSGLKAQVQGVIARVNRRGHRLNIAIQIGERTSRVGGARSGRRAVVNLQATQVHANASEIGDFERGTLGYFALDSERPLADIRRRLAKLVGENERRRAGLREWLRPGKVRRQRISHLVLTDGERYIAHDVE